jgi:hypothetical protein
MPFWAATNFLSVWWNRSTLPQVWGGGFKGSAQLIGESTRFVETEEVAKWESHI